MRVNRLFSIVVAVALAATACGGADSGEVVELVPAQAPTPEGLELEVDEDGRPTKPVEVTDSRTQLAPGVTPVPLDVPEILEPSIPIAKEPVGRDGSIPCWDLEAAGYTVDQDGVSALRYLESVRSRAVGWAVLSPSEARTTGGVDGDTYQLSEKAWVATREDIAAVPQTVFNGAPFVRSLFDAGYERVLVSVNDFGGIDHTAVDIGDSWESVFACHRAFGAVFANAIDVASQQTLVGESVDRASALLALLGARVPTGELVGEIKQGVQGPGTAFATAAEAILRQQETGPIVAAPAWGERAVLARSVLDAPEETQSRLRQGVLALDISDSLAGDTSNVLCALTTLGWSGCVALTYEWGQNEGIDSPDYLPLPILHEPGSPVDLVLKQVDSAISDPGQRLVTIDSEQMTGAETFVRVEIDASGNMQAEVDD